MNDPARHFSKLAPLRRQLEEMASRYPSQNADYLALYEAVRALDRAALHFGLASLWFTGASPWGGGLPHRGCIPPLGPGLSEQGPRGGRETPDLIG